MTAYVTIPNTDIDPESPVTTGLITALRDNATAITEGSIGAPKIQQAAIGTGLGVSQSELKTTDDTSRAGSITTESSVNITLPAYSFFPMIHITDVGGTAYMTGHDTDSSGGDNPRFRFVNPSAVSGETYDIDVRYIAA